MALVLPLTSGVIPEYFVPDSVAALSVLAPEEFL
jgi:hypothetical protein